MPRPMECPGAGELLARVDDVVDLAVLLRRPGPHVRTRVRVRVEAPDVALPQVEGRFAVDQPLRHRLADAAGVGDPDGLRRPEPPHLGRLAEDWEPVGGEGEQAVEPAGQSRAPEAGQHLARRRQGLLEVMGREGHLGRRGGGLLVGGDVAGIHQKRLVLVGADAVALPPTCRKYMASSWWRRIGRDMSSVLPSSSGSGVLTA